MARSLNEVKIQVSRNALILDAFTVESMHRATGLNAESVRTQINRLKEAGYLEVVSQEASVGRGRPANVYQLTDDSEKIKELADEVGRFLGPGEDSLNAEPQSANYATAKALIQRLESEEFSPNQQDLLMREARANIQIVREDAGIGILEGQRVEIIAAYLDLLEARMHKTTKHWQEAGNYLQAAHQVFERYAAADSLAELERHQTEMMLESSLEDYVPLLQKREYIFNVLQNASGVISVGTVYKILVGLLPQNDYASFLPLIEAGNLALSEGDIAKKSADDLVRTLFIKQVFSPFRRLTGNEIVTPFRRELPDMAFDYFRQQLKRYTEQPQLTSLFQEMSLIGLGIDMFRRGDLVKSIIALRGAEVISEEIGDEIGRIWSLYALGSVLRESNNVNTAAKYFLDAKALAEKTDITSDIIHQAIMAEILSMSNYNRYSRLLEDGRTPQGRTLLIEKTGLSKRSLQPWIRRADLIRVKGVGEDYAMLLEAAGVDTVPDLARRNPHNLYTKLIKTNEEKEIVNRSPSQKEVTKWVQIAKQLEPKITY